MNNSRSSQRLIVVTLFLFISLLIWRTAWISDDAAITLRTVLNFIHGFGARFNIYERVQAYTHPLWFLLISAISLVLRNVFFSTQVLSWGLTLVAVWLLIYRWAKNFWIGLGAALLLTLSKAFLDYSTSGLENPLSHLLLMVSVLYGYRAYVNKRDFDRHIFLFCFALQYLSRPDLVLLLLPAVLLIIIKQRQPFSRLSLGLLLAALPPLIWTIFSLIYYGFPFPNTAYAKLGMGIERLELMRQGLNYLLDSLGQDPLTLLTIAIAVYCGFSKQDWWSGTLATGIVLYLLYIIYIGGDFMSGRFLTAPFFLAVLILTQMELATKSLYFLTATLFLVGTLGLWGTWLSGANYSRTDWGNSGIADERGFYFSRYGWANTARGTFSAPDWIIQNKGTQVKGGGLGYASIEAGPGVHFIDEHGLADPLLSRLPAKYSPKWRIGHFYRELPAHYQESIEKNENLLVAGELRDYYEALRRVTRGSLWKKGRLRDIVRLNLRRFSLPSVENQNSSNNALKVERLDIGALQKIVKNGTAWDAPVNKIFAQILEITLPEPTIISEFDVSLDNNDTYSLDYEIDGKFVEMTLIKPVNGAAGMVRHQGKIATTTPPSKLLRIRAVEGDSSYSLGHLVINGEKSRGAQ